MDERLRDLEKAAEQDPENLDKLEALAALTRRSNWQFQGRSLDGWLEHLTTNPELPNLAFWAGDANPAAALEPIWLRLIPVLLDRATDPDRPCLQRCRALMALYPMGIRGRAAARVLIALSRDPDEELRTHAIRALGRCGSALPGGFEALRSVLADPSPRVRRFAPEAWLGAAESPEQLSESLAHMMAQTGFQFTALSADLFASRLDEHRATFAGVLSETLVGLDHANFNAALDLIFANELLPPGRIVALFEESRAQNETWTGYKLSHFLSLLGERATVPAYRAVILEALKDERPVVARGALTALGLGVLRDDPEVMERIMGALRGPREDVAHQALIVAARLWPEREEVLTEVYGACFENDGLTPRQRNRSLQVHYPQVYELLTQPRRRLSLRLEGWARRFFPEPY